MRLRALRFVRFGPLADRTFELGRLAVVHGPNESGKTSFAKGLETLLFGFRPAVRDKHPLHLHDPGGGDLCLTGLVEDGAGHLVAVERALQAQGKLRRIDLGPAAEAEGSGASLLEAQVFEGARGGNGALDQAAFLDRDLFQAVYGLELGDFRDFEEGVRERIDDLLLPRGASALRPAGKVLRELQDEASALWRDDNRGKTRAKALEQERGDLRRRLTAAKADTEGLRAAQERLPENRREQEDLRARRAALEAAGREAEALAELHALDGRRAALEKAHGPGLEGLVDLARPADLEQGLEDLERELALPRARLDQDRSELDAAEAGVLGAAERIAGLSGRLVAWSEDRQDLRNREQQLRRDEAELERGLAGLLGRAPDAAALAWCPSAPVEALTAHLAAWREQRAEARAAREEARRTRTLEDQARALATASQGPGPMRLPWLPVLLGLALALGSAFLDLPLNVLLLAAGLLLVVVPLLRLLRPAATPTATAPTPAPTADPDEAPLPPAPDELVERLAPLGLPAETLATPDGLEPVLRTLDHLRQAAARLGEGPELERGTAELAERARAWADLAAELGLEVAAGDGPVELQGRLDRGLEAARAADARVTEDGRERRAAEQRVADLEARHAETRADLDRVLAHLARAYPDLPDPAQAWSQHQEDLNENGQLAADLRSFERRRADLERLRARLAELDADPAGAELPWSDAARAARATALAELAVEAEDLDEERVELLARTRSGQVESVAEVDDQLAEVEQASREALRDHDRLVLLAGLVGRAQTEFREAHEPDVLRRAGGYLAAFTRGRYKRLAYEEGPPLRLEVIDAAGEQRPVGPPLSRGTRDQVQLALRLALLDHLDEGHERLPLVLDEVLVHWDADRRAEIYPVLRELSAHRQVLLLTCHEPFAAEAAEALGLEPLRLAPA